MSHISAGWCSLGTKGDTMSHTSAGWCSLGTRGDTMSHISAGWCSTRPRTPLAGVLKSTSSFSNGQ